MSEPSRLEKAARLVLDEWKLSGTMPQCIYELGDALDEEKMMRELGTPLFAEVVSPEAQAVLEAAGPLFDACPFRNACATHLEHVPSCPWCSFFAAIRAWRASRETKRRWQAVDGGIFDNSGLRANPVAKFDDEVLARVFVDALNDKLGSTNASD